MMTEHCGTSIGGLNDGSVGGRSGGLSSMGPIVTSVRPAAQPGNAGHSVIDPAALRSALSAVPEQLADDMRAMAAIPTMAMVFI